MSSICFVHERVKQTCGIFNLGPKNDDLKSGPVFIHKYGMLVNENRTKTRIYLGTCNVMWSGLTGCESNLDLFSNLTSCYKLLLLLQF